MTSARKKITTLEEALKSKKPIYVKSNVPGIYILSVQDSLSGVKHAVTIPKTWVPVCLSSYLPKSTIEHDYDLLNAFRVGALTIVDPYDAEIILATQDAQDEQKRTQISAKLSTSKISTIAHNMAKPQSTVEENDYNASQNNQPTPEDDIHPKVVNLVLCISTKTLSIRDATNELRNVDNLTEQDYVYIIDRVEENKFKHYAKEKLAEIQG